MKAWYLLYCKLRSETRAVHNLALQEVDTYLPTLAEKKVVRGKVTIKDVPLFPGYIFIHFDPKVFSVARIHSTRGVGKIVGCSELMTAIDDDIIENIKIRERKISDALQSELNPKADAQLPQINSGDKVRFTEGPFVDLEAIFDEKSGEKRCHVLFEIMGQQKKVSVLKRSIKAV